jgi:glycosyltransferase involved in cell wall biosynthesis
VLVKSFWRRLRLHALRLLVRFVPPAALSRVWHNPLFDAEWYLNEYPDVRTARHGAEHHYRRHGAIEGRNPNAVFDTRWYRDANPDVAASRLSPLDHYYLFGASEGRAPSGSFATEWYLRANPDVARSGLNPLLHYLRHGQAEERPAQPPRDVVEDEPETGTRRILLVVHDAHDHGAQRLALHLARSLKETFKYFTDIVLLGGGVLRPEFERYGRVHMAAGRSPEGIRALLARLRAGGVDTAICNTTVSGALTGTLKGEGYRVLVLVHELPELIRDYGLQGAAADIARNADSVVFPSEAVRDAFAGLAGEMGGRAHVRPQGLYREDVSSATQQHTGWSVRRELGLPDGSPLVLAVGFADMRKGFDLFLEASERIHRAVPGAAFVWLGCENPTLIKQASEAARRSGLDAMLRLLPRVPDVDRYYDAASVLLLPSREDPFPSVVLEALSHGVPVVAFERGNGAAALIDRGCGVVVPDHDVTALADAATALLGDDARRAALGARGREIIAREFKWVDYVFDLLAFAGQPFRRVSVVVPNYNYAQHLEQRLDSIFGQTYPVRDVTVLDDASTDDSLTVLSDLGARHGWAFDVLANDTNSGSVFRQWHKGAALAAGDLLWIAEADDYADARFLERLVPAFDDASTVMAYCESRQVDGAGRVTADSYVDYVKDIDPNRWLSTWSSSGSEALAESFAIRNVVPNVSAVVFDRARLLRVLTDQLESIAGFKVAGDYAAYVRLLLDGRITFLAEPLNNHRRHRAGVTISSFGPSLIKEIALTQGFVREHVPVSASVRRQADDYIKQLEVQFDVMPASERA